MTYSQLEIVRCPAPSDIRLRLVRRTLIPANDGYETEGNSNRLRGLLIAALLVIVIGGSIDLVLDRPNTWRSFHVIFELSMIAAALAIALAMWGGWRRAERSVVSLRRSLDARDAEREHWRQEAARAREDLARAIGRQFDTWQLTAAEREVAFLLLEGFGHKQIAARTGRSERTVRQHAVSIYAKSGQAGRAELAAFFLEGLLPQKDGA